MEQEARPVLAIDVDGVVLDYVSGIRSYAVSLGHAVGCEAHEIRTWSLDEMLPAMTQEEKTALYVSFSTHETFAALAPYEGAAESLVRIKDRLPWLRVVAITSAGSHADTDRLRRANLAAFPIDEIHILGLGESKRRHLSELPRGSVFVDDLVEHVESAEAVGVSAILFRRSYNEAHEHVRTVRDWSEAADAVLTLLDPDHVSEASPTAPTG